MIKITQVISYYHEFDVLVYGNLTLLGSDVHDNKVYLPAPDDGGEIKYTGIFSICPFVGMFITFRENRVLRNV